MAYLARFFLDRILLNPISRVKSLWMLCGLIMVSPLMGASGFLLDRVFTHSETGSLIGPGLTVTSLFGNGARLAETDYFQVKMDYFNYLFDYQSLSVSVAFPVSGGGLGVGYSRLGVEDVPYVSNPDVERPAIQGYFASGYDTLVLAYGMSVFEGTEVGVKVSGLRHFLANSYAQSVALDLAFWHRFTPWLWMGAFTDQWLHTPFKWTGDSHVEDSLNPRLMVSLGVHWDRYKVSVVSDFDLMRYQGSFGLISTLGIVSDIVVSRLGEINQVGYGLSLDLGDISLNYMRSTYRYAALDDIVDKFGLVVQIVDYGYY